MIKSVMFNGVEAAKMMVDGKLAWERSGLPAGYQRCEYLESTGTQMIDTLYHPIPIDTKIEFEFTEPTEVEGTMALMGTRKYANYMDDSSFNIFQRVSSKGTGFRLDIVKGEYYKSPLQKKVKCIIDVNKNIVQFDEKVRIIDGFNLNNGMPTDGSFKLFNFDTSGAFNFDGAIIRIHSFVICDKDIPAVNLVPCLDAAGVPCMYDTVSKQPFYNQGTGEFLYKLA